MAETLTLGQAECMLRLRAGPLWEAIHALPAKAATRGLSSQVVEFLQTETAMMIFALDAELEQVVQDLAARLERDSC